MVCLATPATAQGRGEDLVVSRAYIEDPGGVLSIDDVVSRAAVPFDAVLSKGFSASVYWVRLRVRAPEAGARTVLLISPSFLNDVRLFRRDPKAAQGWEVRVTGNLHPFAERERKAVSLSFVVGVSPPQEDFYFRIKTRSPMTFEVQALSVEDANEQDYWRDIIEVFFVTSMVLLLIWGVHQYFIDKQKILILFCIYQIVYTLYGIALTGYFASLSTRFFPELIDLINAIIYISAVLTSVLFCREIFRPYKPHPLLMKGFLVFILAFPFQMIAMVAGYSDLAIISAALLMKLAVFYYVIVAFSLKKDLFPTRNMLRLFFLSMAVANGAFWAGARLVDDVRAMSLIGVQSLIVDGFVVGVFFAWLVHGRSQYGRRETERQLHMIRQAYEVEQERKRQAEWEARTDFLTGLLNRRSFVDLAERELARSLRYQRPFTLLMIDVDHFKAVNDTRGHLVGDVVLQNVARRIKETLRLIDIFGRTGGEEFAAVIVETGGPEALEIARRLCAVVARDEIVQPEGEPIGVTISIGLTRSNGRSISFSALMNEADQALYAAKRAGRNQVVISQQALGAP
ncbi:Putative diguanylate cyclase (GGDEF domain) [Rhodospirillum rubrum ATCC 11170]|uniref:diguanylate cyclase n=2 Tax=Rhodospirillum rubrum TaxID=1085 RepID=Q2RR55_RHORT|nr:diguanylate cyclase [Rhodospirillum rubrum]ABC23390.1 Putative diguanylate cyclase (GGDEF domain) [Rhodospirillum rubrum ATCC 11170]MBK5955040.1 sensor domain-containing diguanylate cyclase [Rhodospirillum rubrum]QXG79363.1 sensor domain-containing diguanylate cyclase [Rhodospirillum rubrum]HAP99624.1 sensor domain-containing diguanylate cyclase [Rhodospirillum rubrum]HCF18967.1 sensor domain-containing diguanylate cyclase [Rhodospirillum rubrum]